MNTILRTGFQKITHDINFQPASFPKGRNLAEAGHVRSPEEHLKDGLAFMIKAQIVRQASVNSQCYLVKILVNEHRLIEHTTSTCVYRNSGKCKHVAALIYYVNNESSLSKTNFDQARGAPTPKQFVREKYSKGANFDEMFSSKRVEKPKSGCFPPIRAVDFMDNSAIRFSLFLSEMEETNPLISASFNYQEKKGN